MKAGRWLGVCWLLLVLAGCTNQQYDQYLKQGKEALKNNEYQQAVSSLEKAVKEKYEGEAPKLLEQAKMELQVHNLMEKGKKALADKKVDEAISTYTNLLEKYENEADVKDLVKQTETLLAEATQQKVNLLMDSSEYAIKGKDYEYAKKILTKLLELNKDNKQAKTLLTFCENMINGTKALQDTKYDEAVSLFTIALNGQPTNEDAKQLKEEALNDKRESETVVATTPETNWEVAVKEETNTTPVEDQTAPVEDQAKVQFVNTMVSLMNHYQQNVTNQLGGISSGMTTPGVILVSVEQNYRQSLNVVVPYPDYQPIVDNWLLCLETTRDYLEMLKDVKNGDFSANSADIIQKMADYYGATQDGLNAIQ